MARFLKSIKKFFIGETEAAKPNSTEYENTAKEAFENASKKDKAATINQRLLVIHSYQRTNLNELTLVVGDIIIFLEKVRHGWWRGLLNGQIGIFPSDFVESIDSSKQTNKLNNSCSEASSSSKSTAVQSPLRNASTEAPNHVRELYRAVWNFTPEYNSDMLELVQGDIVTILSKDLRRAGWWKGEVHGRVGVFPKDIVMPISSASVSNCMNDRGFSLSKDGTKDEIYVPDTAKAITPNRMCKVTCSYQALRSDELTLDIGDDVEIINYVGCGWWLGKHKGKVGVFPSSTVSKNNSPCKVTDSKFPRLGASKINVSAKVEQSETPRLENAKKIYISRIHLDTPNPTKQQSSFCDTSLPPPELCEVVQSWQCSHNNYLQLSKGDIITILSKDTPFFVTQPFWKGDLKGKVGLFPVKCVVLLPRASCPVIKPLLTADLAPSYNPVAQTTSQERSSCREASDRLRYTQEQLLMYNVSPQPPKPAPELCRVDVDYSPAFSNSVKLKLCRGDIITILDKNTPLPDWWKGRLRDRVGLFQAKYVALLPSQAKNDTSLATGPTLKIPASIVKNPSPECNQVQFEKAETLFAQSPKIPPFGDMKPKVGANIPKSHKQSESDSTANFKSDKAKKPNITNPKKNAAPSTPSSNVEKREKHINFSAKTGKAEKEGKTFVSSVKIAWTRSIVRIPQQTDALKAAKTCLICQVTFRSEKLFRDHLLAGHGSQFLLEPLLAVDGRNKVLDKQVFKVHMILLPRSVPTFMLIIKNTSKVVVILQSVYVFDGNAALHPVFTEGNVLRMAPNYAYEEEVSLDDLVLNTAQDYSLLITGAPLAKDFDYHVVEQYHFKKTAGKCKARTPLLLAKLPAFSIPESVKELYNSKFKNKGAYGPQQVELLDVVEKSKKISSLTSATYRQQLTLLNQIEDLHLLQEFRGYTIEHPKLEVKPSSRFYTLSINQFKKRPNLIEEDGLVRFSIEVKDRIKKFTGTVERMEQSKIVIITEKVLPSNDILKVEFLAVRTTFQLEYRALELLDESLIEKLLFPKYVEGYSSEVFSSFQWFRESMATNKEQMAAVMNIVNQTSFPAPYVLFGPPGTGKTSTLVEAIGQIYKLRPKANVLVAASSNFAANELTSRLLRVVPDESIFRYFSKSTMRKIHEIGGDVLHVSNISGGCYGLPGYEDIYSSRVVVCTLSTAGRLVQANIANKHFSYIFVDECGSAKELSALVPIAGIGTDGTTVNATIVLAGDPKQLGPVIQYDFLSQTNHCMSMLERMMNHELYCKNPRTRKYNPLVITQLRDNFRSHVKLLHFSNYAFYEGQLRAKGSEDVVDWALGWHRLPNPRFPLIFHPIVGQILQDQNSTSMYNKEEAEKVIGYVQDILENGINGREVQQSEIGVISPYARQVIYLKELFKERDWTDIEIGSTEQYQGREKGIIIISTVRTRCNHVGFLANVKRLNVSVTRAQALMIVIGDPRTLEQNRHWKQFIGYCRQNQAVVPSKAKAQRNRANARKSATSSPVIASSAKANTEVEEAFLLSLANDFAKHLRMEDSEDYMCFDYDEEELAEARA